MPPAPILPAERAILPDAGADIAAAFARLDGGARVQVFAFTPDRTELIARIAGARVVLLGGETRIDAATIAAAPALSDIVFLGTGAASYVDLTAAAARGVRVHTIRGYGDRVVAEHAIALMFAVYRDIAAQDAAIRGGGWTAVPLGELGGKTLGLIGLGPIGAQVAWIAGALGMEVLGWARRPMAVPGVRQVPLETVLGAADVVSLHLVLTAETAGFLDARRLRAMKRGAVLINTARAELTDEAEILAMLADGHLAGAGLDVFGIEPLPADHPLRRAPRTVLTAHSGWQSPEAVERLVVAALSILDGLDHTCAGPRRD